MAKISDLTADDKDHGGAQLIFVFILIPESPEVAAEHIRLVNCSSPFKCFLLATYFCFIQAESETVHFHPDSYLCQTMAKQSDDRIQV